MKLPGWGLFVLSAIAGLLVAVLVALVGGALLLGEDDGLIPADTYSEQIMENFYADCVREQSAPGVASGTVEPEEGQVVRLTCTLHEGDIRDNIDLEG